MNKSILFCGYDFEEEEYRGIAFYTKMLIKATKELGCKNYMLTSAKNHKNIMIQNYLTLQKLLYPKSDSLNLYTLPSHLLTSILTNNLLTPKQDNILLNGKINHIKFIDGFLNKRHIYKIIGLWSKLFNIPYKLKTPSEINTVITSCPMYIKINKKIKLIQTVPDIIPCKILEHPPEEDTVVFYKRITSVLKYADVILSISEFTKKELLGLFPKYDEKKIITVYIPVPAYEEEKILSDNNVFQEIVLKKYGLKKGEFVLYVGMIEMRKNIQRLIQSYTHILENLDMPLVLVGSKGWGIKEIRESIPKSLKEKFMFLGYAPTVDKLILYKTAKLFVFPSLYEGFGLPPLEAMSCGCPVVTSNISSLPEICGDAAYYVDPYDIDSIIDGILNVVTNDNVRNELIKKGYERANFFSFENFGNRLKNVLDKI